MTRAVLFDLGDTLFRLDTFDHASVKARFAESFSVRCGLPLEAAQETTATLYAGLQRAMVASYTGGDTAELSIAAATLSDFEPYGDDAPWLAHELDRIFGEHDTARWEAAARRHEVLSALIDSGIRIGFVSNTMTLPGIMDAGLRRFGLRDFADVTVYSVAFGQRKPDPRIYKQALMALGVAPEDAVFVGDRVREDVRGPQSLGMRGVLTHEFRQEDPGDAAPLAIILHLEELVPLVL